MQKFWKNPRFVGTAAYYLMRFLNFTLQIRFEKHAKVVTGEQYLFAFWHGKLFLPAVTLLRQQKTPGAVMVSPSRDGEILTVALEKIGFAVIRGSSRDSGMRALLQTKRKLDRGYSIGFGIDGPIGPIHVIKPGMPFLAQKCKIKIVPVGCAFSRCWVFNKSWDKFELPKPFSKAGLALGEPIEIKPGDNIDEVCAELAKLIHAEEEHARQLVLGRWMRNTINYI